MNIKLNMQEILGKWAYCPRCDSDAMVDLGQPEGWECATCGIKMTVGQQFPTGMTALIWSIPLTQEQMNRYLPKLRGLTGAWIQRKRDKKTPWRVRLCAKLFHVVGWPFGCRALQILDKWGPHD